MFSSFCPPALPLVTCWLWSANTCWSWTGRETKREKKMVKRTSGELLFHAYCHKLALALWSWNLIKGIKVGRRNGICGLCKGPYWEHLMTLPGSEWWVSLKLAFSSTCPVPFSSSLVHIGSLVHWSQGGCSGRISSDSSLLCLPPGPYLLFRRYTGIFDMTASQRQTNAGLPPLLLLSHQQLATLLLLLVIWGRRQSHSITSEDLYQPLQVAPGKLFILLWRKGDALTLPFPWESQIQSTFHIKDILLTNPCLTSNLSIFLQSFIFSWM